MKSVLRNRNQLSPRHQNASEFAEGANDLHWTWSDIHKGPKSKVKMSQKCSSRVGNEMRNRLTVSYPTIGRLICLQKHFENSEISQFLFHLKNNTIHSTAMLLGCTSPPSSRAVSAGRDKVGPSLPWLSMRTRARSRTRQLGVVKLYCHGRTFVACEVHIGWIGWLRLLEKQSQQCFFAEEDEEGAIKIEAVWAEWGWAEAVGSSESACFLIFFWWVCCERGGWREHQQGIVVYRDGIDGEKMSTKMKPK